MVFRTYAIRLKTAAVVLEKYNLKIPTPAAPDATVKVFAPVIVVSCVIPDPSVTVTVDAPAVLSIVNSKEVPCVAANCVAISAAVGNVIVVGAADVE